MLRSILLAAGVLLAAASATYAQRQAADHGASLTVIEAPHPGDGPLEGHAGYFIVEIRNNSDGPIDVLAYDGDWTNNALLVQYAYNPRSASPAWQRTAVPIKTLPLPKVHRLEPAKPGADAGGGRVRLKVPVSSNKDMALPFKFCAKYSPVNEIADFTRYVSKHGSKLWQTDAVSCLTVGGADAADKMPTPLTLELSSDRPAYQTGDEILFSLRFKNISNETVFVYMSPFYKASAFHFTDETGALRKTARPARITAKFDAMWAKEHYRPIGPGESLEWGARAKIVHAWWDKNISLDFGDMMLSAPQEDRA